uniref:Putative sugar phosphate phosphate translocator n=1 Tax=Tetraselmis sp. GSL018 TaxID=582737 RepID=A0A061RBV7_9CHLO|mmetsp:Transcript_16099/g.38175  ORF Transcript_16099/g.38175 Transcript_16099/m.38175 type:complete len:318 (-) Transcript_16099:92-1045(-)
MASRPLMTAFTIVAWYSSNIGVILLNKYVLSFYNFKYPIFLTLCHMLTCTICCQLTVTAGITTPTFVRNVSHLKKISCLAVVFCASVVFGNISLRFLPVSFNQAVGATTPFFTAVLSYLITGAVENTKTYFALIPVMVGIMIASGFEPSFHLMGFLACVGGTGARALKSVIQSVILSDAEDQMDSMNLLRYMAPVASVVLLPLSLLMEDAPFFKAQGIAAEYPTFYFALGVNCFLAFFVNLTNFLVTKYTSALTLQVLGNAKGVVAVAISILLFRNPVSYVALVGYGITVLGVVAYSRAKSSSKAHFNSKAGHDSKV